MYVRKSVGANPLLGAETEHPLYHRALVEYGAFGIEDHYYVRGVPYEGAESLFAPLERLFRPAALGNIGDIKSQEVASRNREDQPLVQNFVDPDLARDRLPTGSPYLPFDRWQVRE